MVFLCGIYSVYFTYMCLAATGLYLLFRILMVDDLTLTQRVRRFLLGCGEILLGGGDEPCGISSYGRGASECFFSA